MTTIALSLPRIRRFRRPPKRLVYQALTVSASLIFILASLLYVIKGLPVSGTFGAVLWLWLYRKDYALLRKYLTEYANGKKLAPVRKSEWFFLVFLYVMAGGVMVPAIVP